MNCRRMFTRVMSSCMCLMSLVAGCTFTFGAVAIGQVEPLKVSASGMLVRIDDCEDYRCDLDLGTLPSSGKVLAALTIENPGDSELYISPDVTLCNCISFRTSSTKITPKGFVICTLEFRTPDRFPRETFTMPITISAGVVPAESHANSVSAAVRLNMNYKLAGLMNLLDLSRDIEIEEGKPMVWSDFPLIITDPVKVADVKVSTSASLRDVIGEIVKSDTGFVLRVGCSAAAVADGPISGEIDVHDPITGRRSSMRLTIRQAARIRVTPNVIAFSNDNRKPNQEGGSIAWRSSAILRIRDVAPQPNDEKADRIESTPAISASCWIGENEVQAIVSPIGKSSTAFRIQMETPLNPMASDAQSGHVASAPHTLKLALNVAGEIVELEFPVIFLQ